MFTTKKFMNCAVRFSRKMASLTEIASLSASQLGHALASTESDSFLIIDCRPFMAFNQSRIHESINVHCPPILKRRSGGFIALEHLVPCERKRNKLVTGSFSQVFVYDEDSTDLANLSKDSNLSLVISSLLKQVIGVNIKFIKGGLVAVREECPVLCRVPSSLRDSQTVSDISINPSQGQPAEILPYLYLGDVSHSCQRRLLEDLNITALLNVSSNCENHFESQYKYMNVQIHDNLNADLLSWFPQIIEFIDGVRSEGGRVLVHCRAGISRSATVCIAYVMQKLSKTVNEAFEFVVAKRSIIDPNLNFLQQLQAFESRMKSKNKRLKTCHLSPLPSSSRPVKDFTEGKTEPPISKASNVFRFSPDTASHTLSSPFPSTSFVPLLPPYSADNKNLQYSLPDFTSLSPSRLSQTAASPNPATRPCNLPLFQVTPPMGDVPPHSTNAILGGTNFLFSPTRQSGSSSYPSTPNTGFVLPSCTPYTASSSVADLSQVERPSGASTFCRNSPPSPFDLSPTSPLSRVCS